MSNVWQADQCDYVEGKVAWMRRRRKDGSEYQLPFMPKTERCTEDAVVTKRVNDKTVKRCAKHINALTDLQERGF
jgi:hypothetical protein